MADIFSLGAYGAPGTHPAHEGSSPSTGDLRRKYNFGDRVSELAIAQDPFFRFVTKLAKKPTDDPQFKFTERRPSFHKRYAYCWGAADSGAPVEGADLSASTTQVSMAGDYESAGNIGSVYGGTAIAIGASGTAPTFFIPGQLIKIPTASVLGASATDYVVFKVSSVAAAASERTWFASGPQYPRWCWCRAADPRCS